MVTLPHWTQLSLREQIGQMVVVRASGYLFDHQIRYPTWEAPAATLKRWLQKLNLGGVIMLGGSAGELYLRIEQLQSWANLPLLVAADIEEGVGQWFSGAIHLPPPMALGAIARADRALAQNYAAQMGAVIAQEAIAVGINWLLAPVVDVNNNPDNPVINVRSFGDTAEVVGELAAAFIAGAHQYSVLTTAKHFPGHGDTATDSHLNLPTLAHDSARLEAVELRPFRRAIAAGVDSVMSAHLLIPAWDDLRPATLSPNVLTTQLRQHLGFEGLIVTDALIMGGVAKYASSEAIAVMAVEAGADVLLMPADPEVAITAIYEAVCSGRIQPERIQQSVARIWQAKSQVLPVSKDPSVKRGLRSPRQDLQENVLDLAQPASIRLRREILQHSLQKGGNLPLKPQSGRNLILVDDVLKCSFLGHHTPAILYPHKAGYTLQLIEQNALPTLKPQPTLLQIFLRGNPFRGHAGLTSATQHWIGQLLKTESVVGLAVYGSPYVLKWLQEQINERLPWVYSYGQMPEAQVIVCQTLLGMSSKPDSAAEDFL